MFRAILALLIQKAVTLKSYAQQIATKDAELNMCGADDLCLYGLLENKEYAY